MRTRPTRLLIPAAAIAALALVAAGCGGGGSKKSASTPATSGSNAGAVTIRESEYKLNPANPKVAGAGATQFQIQNRGTVTHAFEVVGPKGKTRTKDIQPGSSATLKVDLSKPGTYQFYCPIDGHRKLGMAGQVIVAGGGKSSSSGGGTSQPSPSSGGGGGGGGY
jgi:uncharacterized cupredoxin-like copper-binding protein